MTQLIDQDIAVPPLPSYVQAEIAEIEARSEALKQRVLRDRPWSHANQHIGDFQRGRRRLAEIEAQTRLQDGEPVAGVLKTLAAQYRAIAALSQCGCGLLLIGQDDCPRCAGSEPPDWYDTDSEGDEC